MKTIIYKNIKTIFFAGLLFFANGLVVCAAEVSLGNIPNDVSRKIEVVSGYNQNFKENIRSAIDHHPRIASVLAARDGIRFQQREAEAGLYPQLDIGLSGRHRLSEKFEDRFDNITERSRRKTSANASITGRQLLFDGGETFSRINSARHAFSAAQSEYGRETSSVALMAVETHYRVLFQRLRRVLHQENVDRHLKMLQKVTLRFDSGRGPSRDVALMEARLATAQADALEAQKDREIATSQYEEIYGFSPEDLKRPGLMLDIPHDQEAALQLGLLNNPALSIATARTMSAKESFSAQKKSRLPQLSMELSATKYDLDQGNSDYDLTGRLIMNYNLYSGGAGSARTSRSLKNYEQVRHDEASVQREVTRSIKVAYQNRRTQNSRVEALKVAEHANMQSRDQFQEQFEATGGSLLSLLEAEKDYHLAREKYFGSIIESDILAYSVLDVMGTLLPALNIRLKKEDR